MNRYISLSQATLLLLSCTLLLNLGCASKNAQESATWLAAVTNGVKEETAKYKKQRDALAKARQMSINSLEESATALEIHNKNMTFYWTIPDSKKSQQKNLLDKFIAESNAVEKQQQQWTAMRLEHVQKVLKAKSSVVLATDKLNQTNKYLLKLGADPSLRKQTEFYVGFFTEVNEALTTLEGDMEEQQSVGTEAEGGKKMQLVGEAKTVLEGPKGSTDQQ